MADGNILIVDLDGTLLRTNMLHETLFSAVSRDWRNLFMAPMMLIRGKAHLKRFLAERSRLDMATLPLDETVVTYVEKWKAEGGRAALVTATDIGLARAIADEVGLFDEVHGSDGQSNLKGALKADFLCDRFGKNGFVYMGDAHSDLPVWQQSNGAVTVNAPASLRRRVQVASGDVDHLRSFSRNPRDYLEALRPHQWLKNVLIFLPILAAHKLDTSSIFSCLLAFLAFNLVASSSYLINDLLDLQSDRLHPRKRSRPMADGRVPIAHAVLMTIAGLGGGAILALAVTWKFGAVLAFYLLLTLCYSFWLKRKPIIDICTLAGLYTIRIFAGGVVSGTAISTWLLALSIFLFFSLASVKRQSELVSLKKRNMLETSGRGYRAEDLPVVTSAALAAGYVAVLILALYVTSPGVLKLYSRPEFLLGVCCVLLYWISRTVLGAQRDAIHDDPIVFAVTDPVSQLCGVIAAAFVIAATFL